MNRFLLSALMATTLCAGGMAIAQASRPSAPPPPPPGHDFLAQLDSNKDGVITRAEFTADLEKRFAALDTDKNGVISAAERKSARDAKREEHVNARFAALDTDKNNQISREEFRAGAARRDGRDDAGFRADGPPPPGRPGFEGRKDGDRRGPGGNRGKGDFHGPRDDQADVTKEQFMARPLRLFDILDSNDDGKITAAEREAARDRGGRDWGRPGPGPDRGAPKN